MFETRDAIANGANEIDYVVNLTEVKVSNWDYIRDEMDGIVSVCNETAVPSKVIFENCLLTQDEKIALCEIASEVLPTFVKTSTGFSTGGATVEDVRLMREHVDARVRSRLPEASARRTTSSRWWPPAPSASAAARACPSWRSWGLAWRPRASTTTIFKGAKMGPLLLRPNYISPVWSGHA